MVKIDELNEFFDIDKTEARQGLTANRTGRNAIKRTDRILLIEQRRSAR